MVEVQLCMGSSCYARGNSEILETLENYIDDNDLQKSIEIAGAHCLGNCSSGPIVVINGKEYKGIHPSCIIDIVKYHMEEGT